jgi:Trypsin-co-occurring domain 1
MGWDMTDDSTDNVWVQVVALDSQRQITWGSDVAQRLQERIGDVRDAITTGAATVGSSLPALDSPAGWELDEVSTSFGITLTAEAGVLLTKASGEATFEVSITFRRKGGHGSGPRSA